MIFREMRQTARCGVFSYPGNPIGKTGETGDGPACPAARDTEHADGQKTERRGRQGRRPFAVDKEDDPMPNLPEDYRNEADAQTQSPAQLKSEARPPMEAGETTNDLTAENSLTETLLKAVQDRTRRAESSVLRSMAEQNGMPETELAALLQKARETEPVALPPDLQAKLEAAQQSADRRLLMAEVKTVGAEMGLVDAEVALQLMDSGAMTIGEDGAVSGVKEALLALKARKAYLFAPAQNAWAQRVSGSGAQPMSGVEEAFYRKNPTLRK